MTLDLAKVSPQLRQMSQRLLDRREQLGLRLEHARATFAAWAPRWEELRDLAEGRESRAQRLASPREPLDMAAPLPELPPDRWVVATDGSQIEPDRHGPSEYYLINIGWAVLRYGDRAAAELASAPTLAYELDDLFISDEQLRRRVPVQGSHLAARRSVRELERAVELAAASEGLPLVVLQDGTLLLWVLEERPEDFLREAFLRPYVAAMERCQQLGRPLASYISRPRSTEVSSLLRAATCGGEPAGCRACRPRDDSQCALDGLHDRMLFERLEEGQRSALFAATLHEKLERYYLGQRVHFFFVHVGSELARVEIPEWVANDTAQLDLVHAVVYDQCQRGQGYPAALTRAHEQAIVRAADREMLRVLLESMFARQGIQARFSEKAAAKRLRAV
jgi:GNAT superfamily N-acetyltransferase